LDQLGKELQYQTATLLQHLYNLQLSFVDGFTLLDAWGRGHFDIRDLLQCESFLVREVDRLCV